MFSAKFWGILMKIRKLKSTHAEFEQLSYILKNFFLIVANMAYKSNLEKIVF